MSEKECVNIGSKLSQCEYFKTNKLRNKYPNVPPTKMTQIPVITRNPEEIM